jgi:MFS family permease
MKNWLALLPCAYLGKDRQEPEYVKAKRDVLRLKFNWLFLVLASTVRAINYTCVIPTNHQFIINPTIKTLNITNENIEPGLEQSETFYSLTYVVLFSTYTISAVGAGLLFNHVPTWYLFMFSTLSHILGYLLYALATNGWMMILARGLAGVQLAACTSLVFAYCSVSFEKYTENLKILGKYEKKKAKRVKGYVFSLFIVGNSLGFAIGIGKVLIMHRS